MSSYWINFISKGDPNGPGLPAWPQYRHINDILASVLACDPDFTAFPGRANPRILEVIW